MGQPDISLRTGRPELRAEFDAICLTGGSTVPRDLPVPGRDLTLTAAIESPGGVFDPYLWYRPAGTKGFKKISLKRGTGARYSATIPGSEITGDIEYYLQAFDAADLAEATWSSRRTPFLLRAKEPPKPGMLTVHADQVVPLFLGWLVAVGIRLATGSATVATITAAGIVAPLAAGMDRSAVALLQLERPACRHHRVQHVERVESPRKQIAPPGLLEHVGRRHLASLELAPDEVQAAPIDGVGVVAVLRSAGGHHQQRIRTLEDVIRPLVAFRLPGVSEPTEPRLDMRHGYLDIALSASALIDPHSFNSSLSRSYALAGTF